MRHASQPCISVLRISIRFMGTEISIAFLAFEFCLRWQMHYKYHGWSGVFLFSFAEFHFTKPLLSEITKRNKSINTGTTWSDEKNVPWTRKWSQVMKMIYNRTISILDERWARVTKMIHWFAFGRWTGVVHTLLCEKNVKSYMQATNKLDNEFSSPVLKCGTKLTLIFLPHNFWAYDTQQQVKQNSNYAYANACGPYLVYLLVDVGWFSTRDDHYFMIVCRRFTDRR